MDWPAAKRLLWCSWRHRWRKRAYWDGYERDACGACHHHERFSADRLWARQAMKKARGM